MKILDCEWKRPFTFVLVKFMFKMIQFICPKNVNFLFFFLKYTNVDRCVFIITLETVINKISQVTVFGKNRTMSTGLSSVLFYHIRKKKCFV